MSYTVSEIAEIVDMSPHTLRYYAKEGLIPNIKRDKNGVRIFELEDTEWLFVIEALKKSGMSIKEIREYIELLSFGDVTIDERLARYRKQEEMVEKKIEELRETLEVVRYKRWKYELYSEAGTTKVSETLTIDDVPESLKPIAEKLNAMKVR